MLTIALLLIAQGPVLLNTHEDGWLQRDARGQVVFFDASASTVTLEYGYDCVDSALVLSGMHAIKEETACHSDDCSCENGETTFLGYADAPPPDDMSVWWVPPLFGAVYAFPLFTLGTWNSLWALAAAILAFNLFWRSGARRMSEPPPAPVPDGLLDSWMTTVFGRSWRTGISGFAGVALTVAAAVTTIEAPVTWAKVAPLLPSIAMSLGLLSAKDARVSHSQLPK